MEFVSPVKFTVGKKRGELGVYRGNHRLVPMMIYLELDKVKRIHNENKNLMI